LRYFVKKSVASLYSALFVGWSGSPDFALSVVRTPTKSDEVIFEGEEKDGFMKVDTGKGSGWVKAITLRKQ
jgi:hypothetical protein